MNLLQNELFNMLVWFDAYCRENNLRYYVLGGTMLGAARHGGFIPWDDDIDVGMPRADYERFCMLTSGIVFDKYIVESVHSEDRAYSYTFSKIYNTKTTLIENLKEKLVRGIYVDVFPLDGAGNSEKEAKNFFRRVSFYRSFYSTRVFGIRLGRKWWKNLAVSVVCRLPFIDNKKLRIAIDDTCKKHDYDESSWCGNLMGAWGFKEVMPKSILGEPAEYDFEGIKVFGASDFDGYLTHLYGNWRKLPPEEKRISHHDYILLDLDTPYIT